MDQDPAPAVRRPVDWDRMLADSEFQNVTNLVYLGILGLEKHMSEECSLEFYHQYRKGMFLHDAYRSAEKEVLQQLEENRIETLFLRGMDAEGLYHKPEMAYIRRVELFVEKKDMLKVHRLLREMDYERSYERTGDGIVYTRIPGIRFVFYQEVPVENKVFRKYFSDPVGRYLRMDGMRHIHVMTLEETYLYRVGKLVEWYITGNLRIRDVLDFRQFQAALPETFPRDNADALTEKAKWKDFMEQIGILSRLWFGEEGREEFGTALELEEYILSHCRENEQLDQDLLPHENFRLDFYRRERDKEYARRKWAWMFPPWEYMRQFYPVINRHPGLLWLCWIARGLRFLRRILSGVLKNCRIRSSLWLSDVKRKAENKIRSLRIFRKEDGDENREDGDGI